MFSFYLRLRYQPINRFWFKFLELFQLQHWQYWTIGFLLLDR
jgi:hypothetical protein